MMLILARINFRLSMAVMWFIAFCIILIFPLIYSMRLISFLAEK